MPKPNSSGSLYVGLMSGTSMDGIDAAVVKFGNHTCSTLATLQTPYPDELRKALYTASRKPNECSIDTIGNLDQWVAECHRDAVLDLLEANDVHQSTITAIGSHGQTIRHKPRTDRPFTMQIGDPAVISSGTGITTVADFRRGDIAVGGEGAPLAPAFHQWLFAHEREERVVINVGGMANVTILRPPNTTVTGFDTGPGNTLLDAWIQRCRELPYDDKGEWAAGGRVNDALLARLLDDTYIKSAPPKSTGFEYFNEEWLDTQIKSLGIDISNQNIQSTLAEFTARTIAQAVNELAPNAKMVLVCGGGVHNDDLIGRLGNGLPYGEVESTERSGLNPDWVEAAAFAWLARQRLEMQTGNLPDVTGAKRPVVLGAIYA